MTYEEKRTLAHLGDMGLAACAIRLRAARATTGMKQLDFAAAASASKTVYNNAESGITYPNREIMQYLYREHRIDFNFLMNGDFVQLPGDVQDRLFPALVAAKNEWDRRERSGRSRKAQQLVQPET